MEKLKDLKSTVSDLVEKIEEEINTREFRIRSVFGDILRGLLASEVWDTENHKKKIPLEQDIDTLIREIFANSIEVGPGDETWTELRVTPQFHDAYTRIKEVLEAKGIKDLESVLKEKPYRYDKYLKKRKK